MLMLLVKNKENRNLVVYVVKINHRILVFFVFKFQNNLLFIRKLGVYSLKRNAKNVVFIYAYSDQEAIESFTKTFQQTPLNCNEYPLDFELARGNDVITFREMKKEFGSYPAIAGYFTRGE
jgi:hypothetical protein